MTAPMNPREIAVIGGGIAGSALAALLAGAGRDVLLLEKDAFPRDKLCGEFLSAESSKLLDRVGCLQEVLALGPARITQARFFSASGRDAVLDLQGEALGLSRRSLDEALFGHAARRGLRPPKGPACRIEKIQMDRGSKSNGRTGRTSDARLVVAAYAGAAVDARLARPFSARRPRRPQAPSSPRGHRVRRRRPRVDGRVEIHLSRGILRLSLVEANRQCLLLTNRFWGPGRPALGRGLRGRARAQRQPGRPPAALIAEPAFTPWPGSAFHPRGPAWGKCFSSATPRA